MRDLGDHGDRWAVKITPSSLPASSSSQMFFQCLFPASVLHEREIGQPAIGRKNKINWTSLKNPCSSYFRCFRSSLALDIATVNKASFCVAQVRFFHS